MNEEYGKPWPSGLRQSIVKIIQSEMKEFAISSVHASVLKLLQVSVSGSEKSFWGSLLNTTYQREMDSEPVEKEARFLKQY